MPYDLQDDEVIPPRRRHSKTTHSRMPSPSANPVATQQSGGGVQLEGTQLTEVEILAQFDEVSALLKKEGTFVPREIRRITGSGDEALLLSQLMYWFARDKKGKRRAQYHKNGKRYVAKTFEQWGEELGMERRRVKTVVANLVERGLVEIEYGQFGGQKCSLLRPHILNIVGAIAS